MTKEPTKNNRSWAEPLRIALGATLIISIVALAISWPMFSGKPHDVPLAIVGNTKVTIPLKEGLEKKSEGTFDISLIDTKDEATEKIKSREIVGAIVFNPTAPEVLTASANGQAINTLVNGVATGLQTQVAAMTPTGMQPPTVKVQDVVPSHKATFDIGMLALPLIIGSMIGAVLSAVFVASRVQRITMLALCSVFTGIAVYLIFSTWLNVAPNNFIGIAGPVALLLFATATVISGLYSLLGVKGLPLGAALTMLVANPISGIMVSSLFLPGSWGEIGQWLTPGAGATLLRGATYFPDVNVLTMPLLVLSSWAVIGSACILLKSRSAIKK